MLIKVKTKRSYEPFFISGVEGIIETTKPISLNTPKKKTKPSKYIHNPKDKSSFVFKINGVRISEVQLKLQFGNIHLSELFEAI